MLQIKIYHKIIVLYLLLNNSGVKMAGFVGLIRRALLDTINEGRSTGRDLFELGPSLRIIRALCPNPDHL